MAALRRARRLVHRGDRRSRARLPRRPPRLGRPGRRSALAAGRRLRLREPRGARQAHRADRRRSGRCRARAQARPHHVLGRRQRRHPPGHRSRRDRDAVRGCRRAAAAATARRSSCSRASTRTSPRCSAAFRGKVAIYNENIRAIADRYDCIVADQWALKEVQDPRFFDVDRLHYNSLGHHEVARMVLRALNVPNDLQPMQPDPLPVRTWREARTEDFVWARTHFVPWVLRRVRHESSGDDITAKRPDPLPVTTLAPREGLRGRPGEPRLQRQVYGCCSRSAQSATAAGRGDVERVDAARHRDRHDRVRRLQRAPAQPVALGARAAVRPARAGRPRTRRGATASSASASAARWKPSVAAGCRAPRGHSGRRVHGTWNTVPMLTRTLRRYSGSAQRGEMSTASAPSAAALRKAAPDVRVIDDVLEHDDGSRTRDDVGHRSERRSVHRGERAAVHGVAGERLGHLGQRRRTRASRCRRRAASRHRGSHFSWTSTDRGRCPAAERASDHLRRLGDVQAAVGFEHPAQRDIRQIPVVREPRIRRRRRSR